LTIEGSGYESGSDLVLMDPDPGGPKTYGSVSATLKKCTRIWTRIVKNGLQTGKTRLPEVSHIILLLFPLLLVHLLLS
jgi:hypothetical protein